MASVPLGTALREPVERREKEAVVEAGEQVVAEEEMVEGTEAAEEAVEGMEQVVEVVVESDEAIRISY